MKWLNAPNSDEHVLCTDAGQVTEYRVRCDKVTGLYRAYDGELRILERPAIYPCKALCEERYAAERGQGMSAECKQLMRSSPVHSEFAAQKTRKGRYSKRGAA